tara:strand:- start:20775 stop:21005 length:231 start_codon:yes stop_codon:yes gene_type:complete
VLLGHRDGDCSGSFLAMTDPICAVPMMLHPFASNAMIAWMEGTITIQELVYYVTMVDSANVEWALCLLSLYSGASV